MTELKINKGKLRRKETSFQRVHTSLVRSLKRLYGEETTMSMATKRLAEDIYDGTNLLKVLRENGKKKYKK